LRHGQQPRDFVVVLGVDAKHVADREAVTRALDDLDLVARTDGPLGNQPKVRAGPQGLGKPAREHLIVHPHAQPPAGDSGLGDLQHRRADLPPLADKRVVDLNPFSGEVLAEFAVFQ
jgi:hypothetical protein